MQSAGIIRRVAKARRDGYVGCSAQGFACGKCCWFFKGKFKTALRRFNGNSTNAHVEGVHFRSAEYYHPSYIITRLKDTFGVLGIEGALHHRAAIVYRRVRGKNIRAYTRIFKRERR